MQTLQIIASLAAAVSYCALAFLAGFAFVMMKRQEGMVRHICRNSEICMAYAAAENLRNTFRELGDMREALSEMVADERFEEAEHLKADIARVERTALRAAEEFRERYGEYAEVIRVPQRRRR